MRNILPFFALLILMTPSLAQAGQAGLYRCEQEDGTILFADNPINFPVGCRAEEVKSVPRLESDTATLARTGNKGSRTQSSADATKQKRAKTIDRSYETFKAQAEVLVENYLAASKRVHRSSYSMHKVKARQELREIRSQKTDLLKAIDSSVLKSSQRKELQKILSAVSD